MGKSKTVLAHFRPKRPQNALFQTVSEKKRFRLLFCFRFLAAQKSLQRSMKVVKKRTTRSVSRPGSRQTKKTASRSRKRQVSSSPSPPPRSRKTDKKLTKRRRVSSSSRSLSSRSPSPAPKTSRKGSIKIAARGRGRSSIDSSRSSSPVLRTQAKKLAGRRDPKLAAKFAVCQKLLTELMNHEDGWPFLEPVDLTEVRINQPGISYLMTVVSKLTLPCRRASYHQFPRSAPSFAS